MKLPVNVALLPRGTGVYCALAHIAKTISNDRRWIAGRQGPEVPTRAFVEDRRSSWSAPYRPTSFSSIPLVVSFLPAGNVR